MSLTPYEQETIINYNNAESIVSLYTHHRALISKLKRYVEAGTEGITIDREGDDFIEVTLDSKKWIKVSAPRKISEEQKAAASERFKKMHSERKLKKES